MKLVLVTLKLKSYLMIMPSTLLSTHAVVSELPTSQIAEGVRELQETMMHMLSKIMERLDKLASEWATPQLCNGTHQHQNVHWPPMKTDANLKKSVVCLNCGKEGRYLRGCAASSSKPPGSYGPLVQRATRVRITSYRPHLNIWTLILLMLMLPCLFMQG